MTGTDRHCPRDWLIGGDWPDGTFAAEAPDWLAWAVELSRRLRWQRCRLAANPLTRAGATPPLTEGERAHLRAAMDGQAVPDLVVVAEAELRWGVPLWPREPPPPLRRSSVPPRRR